MDVANFEEAWDWVEGVLTEGIFESDIDETGNIMMYNQLVGAIRLRQLRVRNDSCSLSQNIQRIISFDSADTRQAAPDGGRTRTQSFYFPANAEQAALHRDGFWSGGQSDAWVSPPDATPQQGIGACFADYAPDLASKDEYGPCTSEGRQELLPLAAEGIDVMKYNESCFFDTPNPYDTTFREQVIDPDTGDKVDMEILHPGAIACNREFTGPADNGPSLRSLGPAGCIPHRPQETRRASSGFRYLSPTEAKGVPVVAGDDGGGFVRDIESDPADVGEDTPKLDPEKWANAINELKSFAWVDQHTRAMIFSFSIYNANFNLYCACNFFFSFTPGGLIQPGYKFKVFKLDLYEGVKLEERNQVEILPDGTEQPILDPDTGEPLTYMDIWGLIEQIIGSGEARTDILVNVLIFRQFCKQFGRAVYIRYTYGTIMPYLKDIWSMLEVMNITPFFFAWNTRVLQYLLSKQRIDYSASMFGERYAEITQVALAYCTGFNFDSLSILTSFFKLFKYFRLVPALALLWEVVVRAVADMAFFFATFFMFLVAFAIFAEQMFGLNLKNYSGIVDSVITLFQMIFGVVDVYWDLLASQAPGTNRLIATIFFDGYVVWMFFILINVFLAILNDAYSSVKGELEEKKEAARIEKEERIAAGIDTGGSGGVRASIGIMQKAARGRMARYSGQLQRLALRRKIMTPTAVLENAADELGMTIEEVREMEENARKARRRFMPKMGRGGRRRRKLAEQDNGAESDG